MRLSLAVSHTPWIEARVASVRRLLKQLDLEPERNGAAPVDDFLLMTDRAPNAVWSERQWRWAAETDADWCVFLQDDVIAAPNFWPTLRAMLEALPDTAEVMCLEVAQPSAKALYDDGARWLTTSDALIGVGYVIRREALAKFLEWRATELKDGALEEGGLTEDTMIGVWCLVTGRRIWGPLPTIIDHDVSLESTYGNDEHTNRRPLVRWDTVSPEEAVERPSYWRTEPYHIGRFYPASPHIAQRWWKGATRERFARWIADDGSAVLQGVRYRALARVYTEPKFRVFLGTPFRESVHPEHMASVFRLQRMVGMDVLHDLTVEARHEQQDLVRVRSRMLRLAHEAGASHLLFADADNAWDPEAVIGMLHAGKDFVQCPYLRRDGRGYTIRPIERDRKRGFTATEDIEPGNVFEIESTGLGLTLISRACMDKMLAHYRERDAKRAVIDGIESMRDLGGKGRDHLAHLVLELAQEVRAWRAGHMGLTCMDLDRQMGTLSPAVMLFQLMARDGALLSEDSSFAQRWRDIGGKVYLYVGSGSPVAHFGDIKLQGRIEDLGLARGEARP